MGSLIYVWTKRALLWALVYVLVLLSLAVSVPVIFGLLAIPSGGELQVWFWYSVFGVAGSGVCLLLSRKMAKWSHGIKVIDSQTQNSKERWLLNTLAHLAKKAHFKRVPDLGIYPSDEINAFATGPCRSKALIAVSSQMVRELDEQALEGVLAHELSHIANGDMVTMTLLQGMINTLVLIWARLFSRLVSQSVKGRARDAVYFVTFMILQISLCPLGCLMIAYYSRRREFRADLDAANLVGYPPIYAGLNALTKTYGEVDDSRPSQASLKISGHNTKGLAALFATHPPIQERLSTLKRSHSN